MAFRALLFSKNTESNTAMTAACKSTEIRVEVRSDIFTAIEQAKTRTFSCIVVDWTDQPEATFLLKRAREAETNRETIAIAIVDHEPTAGEMRDNRLDFLIYRPIGAEEAQAVFAKASEKMQPSAADENDNDDNNSDSYLEEEASSGDNVTSLSSDAGGSSSESEESGNFAEASSEYVDGNEEVDGSSDSATGKESGRGFAFGKREVFVTAILAAIALGVWRSHDVMALLPVKKIGNLRDSVAGLFSHPNVASPAPSAPIYAQQDAVLNRDQSNAPTPALGLVATASVLADAPSPLPKAFDLPLPEPAFERPKEVVVRVQRPAIPDSMRNSPPIAPPIVVTVNPAQLMPVSVPQSQPALQQSSGERVQISEDVARALLVRSVNPVYPAEAVPQKLHGPVVLQALIARDGSVEDLKIVRGYFVLGKAAVAAVKQWQFQPYSVNGQTAPIQTTITVNFSYPPKQ
jgi:TonB family protein